MKRLIIKLILLVAAVSVLWPGYQHMEFARQRSLATFPPGGLRIESLNTAHGVAVRFGPMISSAGAQSWHRVRLGLCLRAITIDCHFRPAVVQVRIDSLFVVMNVGIGAAVGFLMAGVANMVRSARSPQFKDGETEGS